MTAHRFPYVEAEPSSGSASALPYMPIKLIHGTREVVASAQKRFVVSHAGGDEWGDLGVNVYFQDGKITGHESGD